METTTRSTRSSNVKRNALSLCVVCVRGVGKRGMAKGKANSIQVAVVIKQWWRAKADSGVKHDGPCGCEDATQGDLRSLYYCYTPYPTLQYKAWLLYWSLFLAQAQKAVVLKISPQPRTTPETLSPVISPRQAPSFHYTTTHTPHTRLLQTLGCSFGPSLLSASAARPSF